MKNNTLLKLAVALLVLTLITTTLVSGTYAKYVTTATATGSVTVSKWQADFRTIGTTSGVYTDTVAFDLFGTLGDTGVEGNLLAPGTAGSFTLTYDTDASQVARNVTITLDASSVLSTLPYLKFYSDSGRTTAIPQTAGVYTLINEDLGPTADDTGTVTVYWAWPFDNSDDAGDTADGIAAATYSLTATFTATQLDVAP